MKKTVLIEGMSCEHCVKHVKEALEELGALNIEVSLEKKMAEAEFNEVSDQRIRDVIEDAGYDVVKIVIQDI